MWNELFDIIILQLTKRVSLVCLLGTFCCFLTFAVQVPQKPGMINMWWSISKVDVKEDLLTLFGSKTFRVGLPRWVND